MEDLGCAKATCVKVIAELDSKKGIGLIEKKRQGLGKPDIIYVKNFVTIEVTEQAETTEEKPANTDVSTEVQNLNFKKYNSQTSRGSKSELQEVQKADFQKSNNRTSRGSESELPEVQELNGNYNNTNYTEMSYTNPINLSVQGQDVRTVQTNDTIDEMDEVSAYIELIKQNIE